MKMINEALKIDPNFQEAKNLKIEATEQVEEKISHFMDTAQGLHDSGEFEKLRKMATDISAFAPENQEIKVWIRKAHAAVLEGEMVKNLELAKKFYEKGVYESAKKSAEKVLQVDANNEDALKIIQNAKAEITKPELKLVAFTKIKGFEIATIKIVKTGERFMVKEGDVFAELFKVSAVDYDLKAAVVTFIKTQSQQTLTIGDG